MNGTANISAAAALARRLAARREVVLRLQPSESPLGFSSQQQEQKDRKKKKKKICFLSPHRRSGLDCAAARGRACSHVSLHGRALVTSLVKHVENIWPVPAVCVRGKGKEEGRLDSGGPLWRCPPTSAALPSLMHLLNAPQVVVTERKKGPRRRTRAAQ